MKMRAFAALLTSWVATTASAQVPLAEIGHSYFGDDLGWMLYNVGDRNGDGLDDLAAAYPVRERRLEFRSFSSTNREKLASLDVALARTTSGTSHGWSDANGAALVVMRDDSGGFEVAIAAPGPGRSGRQSGAVETYTGLAEEGHRLHWNGHEGGDEFGAALARIPDIDGDGRDDLAIGVPGAEWPRVEIVSTGHGGRIRFFQGRGRFGSALACTVDPGNLRLERIAIGAPEAGEERKGEVLLHLLRSTNRPRTLRGERAGERCGASLASEDVDGDGVSELVVGSLGSGEVPARIACLTNETWAWKRIWTFDLGAPAASDGLRVTFGGDFDGDGANDVLATSSAATQDGRAELVVLSGRTGTLLHAIRSYEPVLGSVDSTPARSYRSDTLGLPLGNRLSAADAGDQDGDGIRDVWFAMRSDDRGPAMTGSIALLSGSVLGGRTPAPEAPQAPTRVDRGPPAESEPWEVSLDELPLHFESQAPWSQPKRWTNSACAWGEHVAVFDDLDGDGRVDLWIAGFAGSIIDIAGRFVSGATGKRLDGPAQLRLSGSMDVEEFGGVVRLDDLDGDGRGELAVGAFGQTGRGAERVGRVLLVPSKDWKVEREILRPEGDCYEFGAQLELVGDLDGDGARELAIAMTGVLGAEYPGANHVTRTCSVSLFSVGAVETKCLRVLDGDASGDDGFGRALAYGGDWDGDGVGDLAIGAARSSAGAVGGGAVHVHSGSDWSRIASFAGTDPGEGLGREVAWSRDLDGDGRSELVVGAPWCGADDRGRVVVLSSRSGGTLLELRGSRAHAAFGASLAIADFDGDGWDELAVGAPGAWHAGELARGSVSIVTLSDGLERLRISGGDSKLVIAFGDEDGQEWTSSETPYWLDEPTLSFFGRTLAVAPDLDGDGRPDLVIGAPTYLGPDRAGTVYALSGRELAKRFAPDAIETRDR
jgi:hypothetical protein